MNENAQELGKKLYLTAEKDEDLVVLATRSQDALTITQNMTWARRKRRFAILMTRFCWELSDFSNKKKGEHKRTNSIMSFDTVLSVKSKGIDQSKVDTILSLLTIKHYYSQNEGRKIELIFSGGGKITLGVECIEVLLKDVSSPFTSVTASIPRHLDGDSNE